MATPVEGQQLTGNILEIVTREIDLMRTLNYLLDFFRKSSLFVKHNEERDF